MSTDVEPRHSDDEVQRDDDGQRRISKRRGVEKLWRKGTTRWRFTGEEDAEDDFLSRKRSAPRKFQVVKPENERDALVIQMGGPVVIIMDGTEELRAKPGRSSTTENPDSTLVTIGDRVRYVQEGDGNAVITHVYERSTFLSRTSKDGRSFQQVIVANIDQIVIVAAATHELLRPGLLDRYIVATSMGGLNPALCINKMDLVDDEDLATVQEIAEIYLNAGYPVVYSSCVTGEGIGELRNVLKGKVSAFSGHSGVGKTTLLNLIIPDLDEKTRVLSEQSQRGTHTTTKSTLFSLPDGGYLADTPGIREFGLFHFDRSDLHTYYPEFLDYADECHYFSCIHVHEPGCAVIQAVEEGRIPTLRYRNYLQILESESDGSL